VAPADTIETLVACGPRWAGMEGERRAAEEIARELRASGRDAEIEPIRVRPAYPLAHALHMALAVIGNVTSVYAPPLGVAILLLAGISMYGDLTGRFHLARLPFPRRRSQNVTSAGGRAGASARLYLVANHDAARSGLMFNRRRRPFRPLRPLRRLASPMDVAFWTLVISLLLALARMFLGVERDEATILTAAQFVATAILMIAFTLFVDVALSEAVPGANCNASGVAAVLELGRRLDERPPANLDVSLVFPGAREGLMLGMREWLRTHSDELDPRRTFFLNLEGVGSGTVRFVTGEGYVILYQHDARLVQLAESLARRDGGAAADPRPLTLRYATDGVLMPMRGLSSLTICCTDEHDRVPNQRRAADTAERIDDAALELAVEFAESIVREIDAGLVPAMLPSLEPSA
jgi:hypothetical protein